MTKYNIDTNKPVQSSEEYSQFRASSEIEQLRKNTEDIALIFEQQKINIIGVVPKYSDLPTINLNPGDAYFVQLDEIIDNVMYPAGLYIWTGTQWIFNTFLPTDAQFKSGEIVSQGTIIRATTEPSTGEYAIWTADKSFEIISPINISIANLQSGKADLSYVQQQDTNITTYINEQIQLLTATDNNLQQDINNKVSTPAFTISQNAQNLAIQQLAGFLQTLNNRFTNTVSSSLSLNKPLPASGVGIPTTETDIDFIDHVKTNSGVLDLETTDSRIIKVDTTGGDIINIPTNINYAARHTSATDTAITIKLFKTDITGTARTLIKQWDDVLTGSNTSVIFKVIDYTIEAVPIGINYYLYTISSGTANTTAWGSTVKWDITGLSFSQANVPDANVSITSILSFSAPNQKAVNETFDSSIEQLKLDTNNNYKIYNKPEPSSDCNTIIQGGYYSVTSGTNTPSGFASGLMRVERYNSTILYQFFQSINGDKIDSPIFRRGTIDNGITWSSWIYSGQLIELVRWNAGESLSVPKIQSSSINENAISKTQISIYNQNNGESKTGTGNIAPLFSLADETRILSGAPIYTSSTKTWTWRANKIKLVNLNVSPTTSSDVLTAESTIIIYGVLI